MFPGLGKKVLALTALSLLAACNDLPLRRTSESAVVDTVAELSSSPKRAREPTGKPIKTGEDAGFSEIRRTLRRLVAAEETFFAENGTYSDEPALLRFTPEQSTAIRFLWLSRDGWAASGTHADLPSRDCVVFVGRAEAPPTTLKYGRSAHEGVTVCDDRSTPPKRTTPLPKAAPPPAPTADSDTSNALDLLDPRVVMKVDLRNLAHSQETYLRMQGIYARRTQALALQYLWHRDVQIKILTADAQSWAAEATHARSPGKSCVIWFGAVAQRPRTDAQGRVEGRSGVPVCDD